MIKEKNTDRWAYDNSVYFHHNKGYTIMKNLRTVCLGDEKEVEKYIREARCDRAERQPER